MAKTKAVPSWDKIPKPSEVRRPDLSQYQPQQLEPGKARRLAVLLAFKKMAKKGNGVWALSVLGKYGKNPDLMSEEDLLKYEEALRRGQEAYARKVAESEAKEKEGA